MARILVTGSKGTLGQPLVAELAARGHEVWSCDLQHQADDNYFRADVANYRQLERVFEQNYDYVYHLAAEFGRINGEEYYDTLGESNVIGTRNILEWQKKKGRILSVKKKITCFCDEIFVIYLLDYIGRQRSFQ